MPRSRLSEEEYEALAELRYQLRLFFAFSEAAAREAGLEPQQHQLLLAVRASPEPPTIGQLAERLVLKHHSTVELVDRLADRGLVKRTRSTQDRRVAQVQATPKGKVLLEKLSLAHHAELRRAGPRLAKALTFVLNNNTSKGSNDD
ncbi:MAG: MarR family transcriptional regulator [Myxococcaceae bacterium]|nr:MarR family transcriptional regulator [Myxococcaceae bacterium]